MEVTTVFFQPAVTLPAACLFLTCSNSNLKGLCWVDDIAWLRRRGFPIPETRSLFISFLPPFSTVLALFATLVTVSWTGFFESVVGDVSGGVGGVFVRVAVALPSAADLQSWVEMGMGDGGISMHP